MKKFICILLSALMLLALCACNAEVAVPEQTPDTELSESDAPAELADFDIAVCYGNGIYPVKTEAQLLIDAIGGDYECDESDSCHYDGKDRFFTFSLENGDFILFTVPYLDGKDTICSIETSNPDFSTPRGINVGCTLDEVIAVYGENYVQDDINYYYFVGDASSETAFADYPYVYFSIDDGVVSTIGVNSPINHA